MALHPRAWSPVTFISKAWGGRTYDRYITKEGTILGDSLQAGDLVGSNKGFNIHESAGCRCAGVKPSLYTCQETVSASSRINKEVRQCWYSCRACDCYNEVDRLAKYRLRCSKISLRPRWLRVNSRTLAMNFDLL